VHGLLHYMGTRSSMHALCSSSNAAPYRRVSCAAAPQVSGIMIGTVSKSGVDYDYPEGSWGMERWHHLADANADHLTNADYFEPEDAHPNGLAADEEKRQQREERENRERAAKSGDSVHKDRRRLMERRSLVEVPAWLHRLWKQLMG
jgi:hypothetical protein